MPKKDKINAVLLLGTLTFLLILLFSMMGMISVVNASPSSTAKPMRFYFHYVDIPVSVAGTEAHYIMNTTRQFKFLTQQEAYNHSLSKFDLPTMMIDFYLYPNLAGPVTINGTWQVFVWVNSSALHPCTFKMEFREISVEGVELWYSGSLTPVVTSTVGSYVDVPIYCYNLSSVVSAHTFGYDTTIHARVTITTGAKADFRVWYDSPMYPSKAILPCQDYAQPVSVKTYDVNYVETTVFQHNWTESRRKVIVHANITDPFGGYDIYNVNVTIIDPAGQPVLSNVNMTRISDGFWLIKYSHTYEANWTYPETAMLGNYTVRVSVIDNNGYYHFLSYGTFDPYIEYASYIFNIGIVILYNPSFKVVDDVGTSLPRAQVYIRLPNGTTNTLPLYTDDNGVVNLEQVPAGNYRFTIFWKDVIVQQTTQYVDSNGPYTIKCRVYQLTAHVLGTNGVPVHGAYVVVYTHVGIVYDFKMSNSSGHTVFQLPSSDIEGSGPYTIEVYYSTTYWLTQVTAKAIEPSISVTSTRTVTIALTDFPPSIWTTMGFLVIIALVIIGASAVVIFLYMKRIRATSK